MSKPETVNLSNVVRQAFENAGWNKQRVIAELRSCKDPATNEAFRILGIDQAVRYFQTTHRHADQDPIDAELNKFETGGKQRSHTHNADAVAARHNIKAAVREWWDRATLYGGEILLGDATRGQLQTSAEEFGKLESGNRNMRKFHGDLAERMPNDRKKVREAITLEVVMTRARAHHVIA